MNSTNQITSIWEILKTVPDPEVPAINVVDLGVIRDVKFIDHCVEITITPTYTGCPAMGVIEEDIRKALAENNYKEVKINTVLTPSWTTDWITEEAKEKLRAYGIAPPQKNSASKKSLLGIEEAIKCPHCGSNNTQMISQFGSTACKALYKCHDCLEPFDYFKCL